VWLRRVHALGPGASTPIKPAPCCCLLYLLPFPPVLCAAAELDLRPFKKLLSVMGLLRTEHAELAPILRRMPRGLESLCLSAEGAEEAREFDAGKLHLYIPAC
jgi:hypothetical protein